MKKQIRKSNKLKKALKKFILIGSYVVLFSIIGSLMEQTEKMNNELQVMEDSMKDVVIEYTNAINQKDKQIQSLNTVVSDLRLTIEDLDLQTMELAKTNQSYVDELTEFREREELYDKYEYAIMDEGRRTDLKYAEIKLGEQLMVEKGHDPHLMFGSIMVESNANPLAVNKGSGATGYGQFLNSSAKWVWTTLMGNSGYYPDLRKDGEANIRMMATYYDYLYRTQGSTLNVIKYYSGNSTYEGALKYLARVNKYTSKVGVVID